MQAHHSSCQSHPLALRTRFKPPTGVVGVQDLEGQGWGDARLPDLRCPTLAMQINGAAHGACGARWRPLRGLISAAIRPHAWPWEAEQGRSSSPLSLPSTFPPL
jgi:hypothetical protein